MKTNELGTVIWYSTTHTLFNQGGEAKVRKFKELLEKQLYKKPLNAEGLSFSPTQHYNVKLEIDKIWNASNSIRSSVDTENTPNVNSLFREISELQTTIAHLRSKNSSLKTANRLLQDEISNKSTLRDELLSIIDSTKETAQETEMVLLNILSMSRSFGIKKKYTVQRFINSATRKKSERRKKKNLKDI